MKLFMSPRAPYLIGLILLAVMVLIYASTAKLMPSAVDESHASGESNALTAAPSSVVKMHIAKSKYADINLDDLRGMVKAGDKNALEELLTRMRVQTRESSANVYADYSGTKSQDNELWAWRESRGYTRNNTGNAQYRNYNHETISTLMNAGDVLALEEMARRLLDLNYINANEIDIRSALDLRGEIVYKAAVYGSIKSIVTLGADAHTNTNMIKGSPEMKLSKIDEFAWYTVAAKRGDLMPLHSSVDSLSGLYGISFTEDDWLHVSNKADVLYQELERKRAELDLGVFDNSVPETVQNFFDALYPRPKELPSFMP